MIWNRLSAREKYAVGLALGVVVIFIFVQLAMMPLFAQRERLQRMVAAKIKIVEDMHLLQYEYEEIEKQQRLLKNRFAKRERGFKLFAFLEKLAGAVGIEDHISYMKPSVSIKKESLYRVSLVEMKLKGITLKQMMAFLHGAETSKNMITIRRVSIIKDDQKRGTLSAVLQAAAQS